MLVFHVTAIPLDFRSLGKNKPQRNRKIGVRPRIFPMGIAPRIATAERGFTPNYDEAEVPAYELPDPLVFEDGTAVTKLLAVP
jgi:hypothetical protein